MSNGKNDNAWSRTSIDADKPDKREIRPREFVMPSKSVESENDIPTIPDMDELANSPDSNSASKEKASASSDGPSDRNAPYQGLDSELLKQNSFVTLDGINLTPLFKFFHSDVNVKEADTEWTVDSLFKDLAEYYPADAS